MKQIIVNVSGLSVEEKQRVNEALSKITGCDKAQFPGLNTRWFYAPSSYDKSRVTYSANTLSSGNKPATHTPQQVLEMAGMASAAEQIILADTLIITDSSGNIVYDSTPDSLNNFIKQRTRAGKGEALTRSGFSVKTDENGVAVMVEKRKVRKDFDPTKEYSVDVSGCTAEGKKEVQQAFFDAGFLWEIGGNGYQCLDAVQYSNTTGDGRVTKYCMYGTTTKECNMDPEEFFSYVYEPVQCSNQPKITNVGNENMNKNYENLVKKVKTLKTNLTNAETFLNNMVHGQNLLVRGLPSPHPETKFFGKITSGIKGEYGHINLCDLQEPELAPLRELISLYTRRIEDEKEEGEAKIAAIEELLS